MLASVYNYRVMVKSVSSCCVRGKQVLSNPVTNVDISEFQPCIGTYTLYIPEHKLV